MITLSKEDRELLISALAAWLTIMVPLLPFDERHRQAIALAKRIANRT
jgi:hypothetical protein